MKFLLCPLKKLHPQNTNSAPMPVPSDPASEDTSVAILPTVDTQLSHVDIQHDAFWNNLQPVTIPAQTHSYVNKMPGLIWHTTVTYLFVTHCHKSSFKDNSPKKLIRRK